MDYYGDSQDNVSTSSGCLTSSCLPATSQQSFHSTNTGVQVTGNTSTSGTSANFLGNSSNQLLGDLYVSNNQSSNSAYCSSFHSKQQAFYTSNQSYNPGCSSQNNVVNENGILLSSNTELQQQPVKVGEKTTLTSSVTQPNTSYPSSNVQHIMSNGQISTESNSQQNVANNNSEHKANNNSASSATATVMNQSSWSATTGTVGANCDNNASLMYNSGNNSANVNHLMASGYEYIYPQLNRLYSTQQHHASARNAPHHYAMVSVPYNQTVRGGNSTQYLLGENSTHQDYLGTAVTNSNNQRRQSSPHETASAYYAKQQPSTPQQSFYYGYPYMHLSRMNSTPTTAKHSTMLGGNSESMQLSSSGGPSTSLNYSATDCADIKHQINSSQHNTSTNSSNDMIKTSSSTNLVLNSSSSSQPNNLFDNSKTVGLSSYTHQSTSGSVKLHTTATTPANTASNNGSSASNSKNESSAVNASNTPSPNSTYMNASTSNNRKQTFTVLDSYSVNQCGGLNNNAAMYSNFAHHPSYLSQQQQQKGTSGGVQLTGLIQHQQPQPIIQGSSSQSGLQGPSCSSNPPGSNNSGVLQGIVTNAQSPSMQQKSTQVHTTTQGTSNSSVVSSPHQLKQHQMQKKNVTNVSASVKPSISNLKQQLVRRPRGRPRKYPTAQHFTNYTASASASPQNASLSNAATSHNSTNSFSSYEDNPVRRIQHQAERSKYANSVLEHLRCFSEYYIQQLCEEQLEELHSTVEAGYIDDVCEEYLGCGGPFTRLATTVVLHQQGKQALHVTEDEEDISKHILALSDDVSIKQAMTMTQDKEGAFEGVNDENISFQQEQQDNVAKSSIIVHKNDEQLQDGSEDQSTLFHTLNSSIKVDSIKEANVKEEALMKTKHACTDSDASNHVGFTGAIADHNSSLYNALKNEEHEQQKEEFEQDKQDQDKQEQDREEQQMLQQHNQQQHNMDEGKEVYDLNEAFKRVYNEKRDNWSHRQIGSTNKNVINLNQSFLWAGLNPRIPVRDLIISRHHMAILLNNHQIFLYRHFTHPLVTTKIDQWEHIKFFDNLNAVSLRLTSALLAENWREQYHDSFRKKKIERICQELTSKNVCLPSNLSSEDYSEEFLNFLIENHPEGILAQKSFDPNWLPEPCVMVALDQSGAMHVAKCSGYYNYPSVVSGITTDVNKQKKVIDSSVIASNSTSMTQVNYRFLLDEKKELADEDSDTPTTQLKVQDLALAELTKEAILSTEDDIGLALVMYSADPEKTEHSVYIKGKNMFVCFKNFPIGPAKLHCSPLGYTGALLLANGTVWSWSAQSASSGKTTAVIRQVGGSLSGRHVIDLACLGADFLALTSDGVVHEWNNYTPYLMHHSDKISNVAIDLPYILVRPMISEPIELTPAFQNEILSNSILLRADYQVRQFSWIYSGVARQQEQPAVVQNQPGSSETESTTCTSALPEDSFSLSTPDETKGLMSDVISPIMTLDKTINNPETLKISSSCNKKLLQDQTSANEETLETVLESNRQNEIALLYGGDKAKIDRVFIMEGVTVFIRNGVVDVFPNSLGSYRGTSHFYWESQTFGQYTFTCNDILPLVITLGKKFENHVPLPVNPVLMAQINLSEKFCLKKQGFGYTEEQQNFHVNNSLRTELIQMASSSPPKYRLLVSPVSIIVSTLKRVQFSETIQLKKKIEAQLPLLVAAYAPSLYLQAFTNITSTMLSSNFLNSSQRLLNNSVGGSLLNDIEKRKLSTSRRLKPAAGSLAGVNKKQDGGATSVDESSNDELLSEVAGSSNQQQQSNIEDGNLSEHTGEINPPSADENHNNNVQNPESVITTTTSFEDQSLSDEVESKVFNTNKRHRRHNATFDGQNYITGFAGDSDGSEETWEQILNTLDEEKQPQKKKKSGRKKKKLSNFAICKDETSSKAENLARLSVSGRFAPEIGEASAGI